MRENFLSISLPRGGTVADKFEVGTGGHRVLTDGHAGSSRHDRDGISLWDPSLRSERKAFLKTWGIVSPDVVGERFRRSQN